MFNSNRYRTRGIANEVGLDLQIVLWNCIDKRMKTGKIDYLQVFQLSTIRKGGQVLQKIVHTQEMPCMKDSYLLKDIYEPLNMRIWIIDSIEYAMMLLPEEY